jgi:hypothetical protein
MAKEKMNMSDMAQDKKTAKKAIGMHEKQLHGGKKSDLAKLKKGGPTSSDMKKMGRNLARVANQKSSSRGK